MSNYPTGHYNLSTALLPTQMMEPISGAALQPILPLNTEIDPKMLSNEPIQLLPSAILRSEPSNLLQIGASLPQTANFGAPVAASTLSFVQPADTTRQPSPPTFTAFSPHRRHQQVPEAPVQRVVRSSTLTASAAHAMCKRPRSSAAQPYVDLNWPSALLNTTFFSTCPRHAHKNRSQLNHFCLGCGPTNPSAGTQLCPHCALDHNDHCNGKCIPLYRFMYNDVIRISDLSGVLDVSGIQHVKSNNHSAVHLRARGGSSIKTAKYEKACKGGCGRLMLYQWDYRSIACKLGVQGQADGAEGGGGPALQKREAGAGDKAAASTVVSAQGEEGSPRRVSAARSAAGEMRAGGSGRKRSAAGPRSGKGVEEAAKGAKRRKNAPRKSPSL